MDDNTFSIARLNNGVKQNHLTSLFQGLENILTDKSKSYQDKVQASLAVWQQLVNFISEKSKESPQSYFDSLFLNTLRFVLRADWPKSINTATKTHLSVTLQRLIGVLNKCGTHHSILQQCKILESIVKDPWGQSALSKILRSHEVDLNECEEYFNLENPKVVVVRLEMLLLSKCEDFAINLCKACLDTYSNLEGTLDFNQDEIDYITDIYFSSLLRKKNKPELITEIKKYPLDEGLSLLQRYRKDTVGGKFKESCKLARVWKCNDKLIELLSNTLLANAVMHEELLESQSQLEALIAEWAAVMTVDGELSPNALKMIRKFVLIAQSSTCIYPFCSFLIRNGNCKQQDFTMVTECLIRAINQNINEVEQHRVNREREKLKETYGQLSKGFLLLSDLLNEYQNIYKECLLTSFSLTPSLECLLIIEAFVTKLTNVTDLPVESKSEESQKDESKQPSDLSSVELENPTSAGAEVTISSKTTSESPEILPATTTEITPSPKDTTDCLNEILKTMGVPEKNVDNQISEEFDSKQLNKQIDFEKGSSSAYIIELENLLKSFTEAMAGDLNTILNYRRYHTLSWDLEWTKLKANCEKYLEDFEKIDFEDVELKYLDLDYNEFKDRPINNEDLYGIEKGYEQYAFSASESEEELSSTKRSGVSSIESDEDILLIHRKRKKPISSDSDEPKNKKKRGRKPKPKSEEVKRRDSQKSDAGSNPEDDKILDTIESVIAESTNADNLRELRSFRITSLKTLNGRLIDVNEDECEMDEITKEQEELNNFLADSCKSLECIEIPPLSPRFNIYEIILDNTLVPSDSEKRLPKCEDLTYNNSENLFMQNITAVESNNDEEKPRELVAKEKNRNARKKSPKISKPKLKMVFRPNLNESYLTYSSSSSTVLSKDQVFKKKYTSKQKKHKEEPMQNHNTDNAAVSSAKDLVVQLPKLNESFTFTSKKSLVMKPIDQNVTFTSYLKDSLDDKSAISTAIYEALNDNTKYNMYSQNSVSVATDTTSDTIEDIENFLKAYQSPNYTPTHATNTSQCYQQPQTTVENTCQTDITAPQVELWQNNMADFEHLLDSNSTHNPPNFESPKSLPNQNICKVIPTTPRFITAASSQSTNMIPSYTCTARNNNNITIKRTGAEKVDKILHDYQTAIAENPDLKNVPAPRKRGNSTNKPRKPRSRAKNDHQAVKIVKISKTNGFVDGKVTNMAESAQISELTNLSVPNGTETAPQNVSYAENLFYDKSTKLPPNNASSQVISVVADQLPNRYSAGADDDSKPIQGRFVQNVSVPGPPKNVESGTLKALLMQGNVTPKVNQASYTATITNGQHINPTVTRISNQRQTVTHSATRVNNLGSQISPQTSQINNLGQQISPKMSQVNLGQQISPQTGQINHVSRMQHNNIPMNAVSANTTYNSFNSLSSPPKATQYLKGYEGLTNNFEVRIPRIDQRVNITAAYSANNLQYSCSNSKTTSNTKNTNSYLNIPPVSSNLLPSVVIPMLPATAIQTARNNSTVNMHSNYQMNNFIVTTVANVPPVTSTMPNVHVNINSTMSMNNVIGNIQNHLSPNVVLSNTLNIKHEFNSPLVHANVGSNTADDFSDTDRPCLSIPESSLTEGLFGLEYERYLSLI